jgi:hypothetical protein
MRYKIQIKTLQGIILTYNVDEYTLDNNLICFIDKRTNKKKMFSTSRCEIEGVEND